MSKEQESFPHQDAARIAGFLLTSGRRPCAGAWGRAYWL